MTPQERIEAAREWLETNTYCDCDGCSHKMKTILQCLEFTKRAMGKPSDAIARRGIAAFNSVPTDDIHNTTALWGKTYALIAA